MVDINGVELAIGDNVIYTNRNNNGLVKGVVFKITKSRVVVKYSEDGAPVTYGTPPKTYIAKYHDNVMYSSQIMKLG